MKKSLFWSAAALVGASLATVPLSAEAVPAKKTETVVVKKVVRAGDGAEMKGDSAEAKALIAACDGRKFESSAELGEGKERHRTKIKLCAKGSESDGEWTASLQKARDRLNGMSEIAPESRARIVAELDAEIARLKTGGAKH